MTVYCKHRKAPSDDACAYCQGKHDEREWIVTFGNDPFARYREWAQVKAENARLAHELDVAQIGWAQTCDEMEIIASRLALAEKVVSAARTTYHGPCYSHCPICIALAVIDAASKEEK